VGGTGAMLGLAKNKLSGNDYSQLGKSVPGLDKLSGNNALGSLGALSGMLGQTGGSKTSGLDSLLGNVKDTNDLNTAFSALGMDSGMIGQFAPVILQYLGGRAPAAPCWANWPRPGAPAVKSMFRAQLFDARSFSVQSWLTQFWTLWRNAGSFS
jgi:hypothetical protein